MKRFPAVLALVISFLFLRTAASAQLFLPLDQPDLSGLPGQTLSFFGPLVNPTPDFWEFGGISFDFPYAGFTINNKIAVIGGIIVDPNSEIPGNPFDITIGSNVAPGFYAGVVNVHGVQIDINTGLPIQEATTRTPFSVNVTPEGNSLAMLAAGALPLLGFLVRRRRAQR